MHLTVLTGWEKRKLELFDRSRLFSCISSRIFLKKELHFCVSPITLGLCQIEMCIQPRGAQQKGQFGRNWTDKTAASLACDLMWHPAHELPLQSITSSDPVIASVQKNLKKIAKQRMKVGGGSKIL